MRKRKTFINNRLDIRNKIGSSPTPLSLKARHPLGGKQASAYLPRDPAYNPFGNKHLGPSRLPMRDKGKSSEA